MPELKIDLSEPVAGGSAGASADDKPMRRFVVGCWRQLDVLAAIHLLGYGWVKRAPGYAGGAPASNCRWLMPRKIFQAAKAGESVEVFPFKVAVDEPVEAVDLAPDWDYRVPCVVSSGDDWSGLRDVMQEQENAGFWWLIKTPAEPGERYWAGLAPHGASSLNEVPDHYCKGRTLAEAVVLCGLANKGIAIELADDLAYSRG